VDRDLFVRKISEKLRLIRNEFDYTQDRMAEVLGISKKTLIQIEKGRTNLGWPEAVTTCVIFRDSEILQMIFGGSPQDLILMLSFNHYVPAGDKTMGGKVWWRDLKQCNGFRIQQNIISQHFRLLDPQNRRILSAFELEIIQKRFDELTGVK